jgi:hypothetical protein
VEGGGGVSDGYAASPSFVPKSNPLTAIAAAVMLRLGLFMSRSVTYTTRLI